jgi:hypothetical protein
LTALSCVVRPALPLLSRPPAKNRYQFCSLCMQRLVAAMNAGLEDEGAAKKVEVQKKLVQKKLTSCVATLCGKFPIKFRPTK